MPKHGRGTSGGAGPESAGTMPLPDLGGVDLHELRGMDDPTLLAAVDEVLRGPERFTDTWWDDGGEGSEPRSAALRARTPGAGREGA